MEVRNVDGRIVGDIDGDTLLKNVKKSKHFHRVLNSWGMDKAILRKDFRKVQIHETENDQTYLSSKSDWSEHGIIKDFGYGEQVFLPLRFFQVINSKQLHL